MIMEMECTHRHLMMGHETRILVKIMENQNRISISLIQFNIIIKFK